MTSVRSPWPEVMPAAWLGYSPSPRFKRLTVRICARCPDRPVAEKLARDLGADVTHTWCPGCAKKVLAES